MDVFWTIITANITYNRAQNYIIVIVDEPEIQTFKIMVVAFIVVIQCFVLTTAHSSLTLDK